MKCKNVTTEEEEKNKIYKYEITAETWEENKILAKEMGIEIDEPKYVEYTIDLKKENKNMNELNDVRSYNCGASDYSKHKFQSWDFWILFRLNPWDADLVKRELRIKKNRR